MPFLSTTTREPFKAEYILNNTILVVLTDCQGEWPAKGFGAFLQKTFPAAYARYRGICFEYSSLSKLPTSKLAGTCHIIPPMSADFKGTGVPCVYIACVFVSFGDGHRNWFSFSKPGRDRKSKVLAQTDSGLAHLRAQLVQKGKEHLPGTRPGTEWTMTGKNMVVARERENHKDYQLKDHEIRQLVYKNFSDFKGDFLIWNRAIVKDDKARYRTLQHYLDRDGHQARDLTYDACHRLAWIMFLSEFLDL
ncbi:hypothetical protein F5Y13DRAFT_187850 [Hypoxylon sp. FL1857]|nr:hypothetical protein F5Y13DRAFT_187850 [Hypoxylon sp. FL1857]